MIESDQPHPSSRKRRRVWRWVAGLLVAYTLFGFLLAPVILRAVLVSQLKKLVHRDVHIAKVRLNPYVLSVSIEGFTICERDGSSFVAWNRVFANAQLSSLFHLGLVLKEVSIERPYVHAQLNADGTYNFSDILAALPASTPATNEPAKPPPLVRIGELRIAGGQAVYTDLSKPAPFTTTLGPIDVSLHNFSTRPDSLNPYSFTAITESGEKFAWRGHFSLAPIRSSGQFSLAGIRLPKYAPFYEPLVNLRLRDGTLNVNAAYLVELSPQRNVAYLTNATVSVRSLRIAERGADEDAISIAELTVAETFADPFALRVEVGSITLTGAVIRARILTNHTINLLALVQPPSPARSSTAAGTNAPPATPTPNVTAAVREVRLDGFRIDLAGILGAQTLQWQRLAVTNITAQTQPASFRVAAITLANASLSHADSDVQPNANVTVTGIRATIADIASDEHAPTTVAVAGNVGRVGAFEVTGTVLPFSLKRADLAVMFKSVDLLSSDPYFGKYVGYRLSQGALSLDLKYAVTDRKLDAQNVIVVDQLTLGDATGSPDAVKLPVKLGLAVLKDRNGVIHLDVPITGSFDDPEFHLRKMILQTLANLFIKIMTSPFAALGSMFGAGGEDLSKIGFVAGGAEMPGMEARKLDVLIKALVERPALHLEITGCADAESDLDGLKRAKLDAELRRLKGQQTGLKDVAVEQITLTAEERERYLREAYLAALPKIVPPEVSSASAPAFSNVQKVAPRKALPGGPATAAPSSTALLQARREAGKLPAAEMEAKLLSVTSVNSEDFVHLADRRAAAVHEYLMKAGQIEQGRVEVVALVAGTEPRRGTGVELGLK